MVLSANKALFADILGIDTDLAAGRCRDTGTAAFEGPLFVTRARSGRLKIFQRIRMLIHRFVGRSLQRPSPPFDRCTSVASIPEGHAFGPIQSARRDRFREIWIPDAIKAKKDL
jgi:hypothetical protein